MVDDCVVRHMYLASFDKRGYRDDNGELLRIPLKVIGHGDDRLVVVTHKNYLGRLVEQLGVGLSDVEAAKSLDLGGG